jgi:hypothetical protein
MKICLLLLSLGLTFRGLAQSNEVKNLLDSQNYVFRAQAALPSTAPVRNLPPDYDLRITRSSVVSYLPYYGDSYTAPLDASKEGLEFTSTDFNYAIKPGKKDGWIVTIKPKDYTDVQQMTMTISSEGYISLKVICANRQPISFNGVIAAPDKGK